MHFPARSAVGLGLMAAHVTAIVLPNVLGPIATVVPSGLPLTITVTSTVTGLPPTASLNLTASLNSTALLNTTSSLNLTATAKPTVSIKTSGTPSTVLPTPTTPPTSGLTADQQKALDLHKIYRAQVGNGDLTWDDGLAQSAQKWANYLAASSLFQHDPNTGGQGENLAYFQGVTGSQYANAVQLWLDEKNLYDGKPITDKAGVPNYHTYGHYTQCIWKSTNKVGMAMATGPDNKVYVVARYLPPGNYIGQMPY